MSTTIKFKRSSVPGKAPTTSDLNAGEVGINIRDGKMFGANSSAVFEIGANVEAIHVGSITIGNGATTFTLPTARGTDGQFLKTNGSGTLSFTSINFTSNAYAASNTYVQRYMEVANVNSRIANQTTKFLEVANAESIVPNTLPQYLQVANSTQYAQMANVVAKTGGTFTSDVQFANTVDAHDIFVNTHILFSNSNMGSAANGAHPPYQEGLLFYDTIHRTFNFYSDNPDVVHEIGIEEHQRVYNDSNVTIPKGAAVYFSGNYTGGNIDVPTVAMADASDVNKYNAQGLMASETNNNEYGYVIVAGQLDGVDTTHLSADANFFVSATTAGSHQNQSPTYPNFPMCLGWVVTSSANGTLLVNQQNHSVNSFRVRSSAHIGTDLRVDGNLLVVGSTQTTSTAEQTTGTTMFRVNEGSAIGEAGTTFTGTGLDDAFFSGHFTGTANTTYYVRICTAGAGLGTGGVDTFDVALNANFNPMLSVNNNITGSEQLIHSADNISVEFGATTGHTANDQWSGTARPVNVDNGFWGNRNTGTEGIGYTHMGMFFDVTDDRWKFVNQYRPTPEGNIQTGNNTFILGEVQANNWYGNFTGDLTGNVSGSATSLTNNRDITLTGDVTGTSPFNGSNNAVITTVVADSVTAPYLQKANASIYMEKANTTVFLEKANASIYLEVANISSYGFSSNSYAASNTYVNNQDNAILANVNPRITSVVGTAATANTKAVQALADAAAANTRAENARSVAVNANSNLNAYKANTNPRFDLYLAVANAAAVIANNTTNYLQVANASVYLEKANASIYLEVANVVSLIANNTTKYLEVANVSVTSTDPYLEVANASVYLEKANASIYMEVANASSLTGDNSFSGTNDFNGMINFGPYREKLKNISYTSGTLTLNLNEARNFKVTLGGSVANTDFNVTNPAANANFIDSFTVIFIQDGTGNRSVTFPPTVKFAGGTDRALSTGADDIDVFTFFSYDQGNTYIASVAGTDFI